MRRHILTLKLTDEEYDTLERRAQALGFYRHGFIRSTLRIALGLPVAKRDRELIGMERSGTTVTR